MTRMKIEHVQTDSAFDWSPHHHPFINPYNGCQGGCPFCFWLSQEGWEGRVEVRLNLPELLEKTLQDWPTKEFLYMGSICDPFMELDETYALTRECLKCVARHEVPLLITTSAEGRTIFRDLDILREIRPRLIVVIELARIKSLEWLQAGKSHPGICHANELRRAGFEVWTTLSPLLPNVADLGAVLDSLLPDIPVYIDRLECKPGTVQAKRILEWISRDYPQTLEQYKRIIYDNDSSWFERTLQEHRHNSRIHVFPFEL